MGDFSLSGSQFTRNDFLQLLLRVSVASVVTYYSVKWMISQLDPTTKSKKKARAKAEEQIRRLNTRPEDGNSPFRVDIGTLSDYEMMIASHLVVPEDIPVSWNDIAGLDDVIQELKDSVVLPVRCRQVFNQSKLWAAPKGVLLHGPPGCGKTLIAKATAKEAGMRFINLDVAILTDKWYGESQKLASAVFTLAKKIQPCIIFIDEIDSFLRSRNSQDHEATAMMKTQFMMLWDGLSTGVDTTVIVMGATNRPQDLDKAILRRMPAQFHIGLPSKEQRRNILQLILQNENIAQDVDLNILADLTQGFSGSDLKELCRNASVYRMRHFMQSHKNEIEANNLNPNQQLASISMNDLKKSFSKMKDSKSHTGLLFYDHRTELDE